MSRPQQVLIASLCIAAMIYFAVPLPPLVYWPVALVVAAALSFAAGGGRGKIWLGSSRYLCDNCKYNHPRYCSRPERPNATRCPDFKSRGG